MKKGQNSHFNHKTESLCRQIHCTDCHVALPVSDTNPQIHKSHVPLTHAHVPSGSPRSPPLFLRFPPENRKSKPFPPQTPNARSEPDRLDPNTSGAPPRLNRISKPRFRQWSPFWLARWSTLSSTGSNPSPETSSSCRDALCSSPI